MFNSFYLQCVIIMFMLSAKMGRYLTAVKLLHLHLDETWRKFVLLIIGVKEIYRREQNVCFAASHAGVQNA